MTHPEQLQPLQTERRHRSEAFTAWVLGNYAQAWAKRAK